MIIRTKVFLFTFIKIYEDDSLNNQKQGKSNNIDITGLITHNVDVVNNIIGTSHNNNNQNIQYIILRANSNEKIRNSISIMKNKLKLRITEEPKSMLPMIADNLTEEVLNSKLKNSCKVAVVMSVEISNIPQFLKKLREIRIPVHVVLVTPKYKRVYSRLKTSFPSLNPFR